MNRSSRIPPRRPRRVARTVAGMALATLALSGCTQTLLGAAAVVEGKPISVTDIEGSLHRTRELQIRYAGDAPENPKAAQNELQRRIINQVFEEAAKDLGVTVTDGELASRETGERQAAGSETAFVQAWALRNNIDLDQVGEALRREVLIGKLLVKIKAQAGGKLTEQAAQDALTERLIETARTMRIQINPRYGEFDPKTGQIAPSSPDYFRVEPDAEADVVPTAP